MLSFIKLLSDSDFFVYISIEIENTNSCFPVEKKQICHKELLPSDHIEKIEKSSSSFMVFLSRENIKSCIFTAVKIQVFIFSRL